MESSLDLFLIDNEKQVNKIFSILLFAVIPIFIIFIALGFIFPAFNINKEILFGVLFFLIAFSVHYYFFGSSEIPEKAKKYVLLTILNLIIFCISLEKGVNVYLMYCTTVILSCLYFNTKFSIFASCFGCVVIIVSLFLRKNIVYEEYIRFGNRTRWALLTGITTVFEYFLVSIFCFYLSKTIRNILISIYNHKQNLHKNQDSLLEGFSNMIEAKDEYTGGHIKRTSEYVQLICDRLRSKNLYLDTVNEENTEILVKAAPFHDLGKIAVPESLLNKAGKLTDEEFAIIKQHPVTGAEFISNKLSPLEDEKLINTALEMSLYHHEKFDGTGYPQGLKGNKIPVSARIMAAADILDALLSKRSYKKPYSVKVTIEMIKGMAGKTLDPVIVYVLTDCENEIKNILAKEGKNG